MGTHTSNDDTCPNCESKEMTVVVDTKDILNNYGYCLECGFYFETKTGYYKLMELNSMREDNSMPALDRLPRRNKNV